MTLSSVRKMNDKQIWVFWKYQLGIVLLHLDYEVVEHDEEIVQCLVLFMMLWVVVILRQN